MKGIPISAELFISGIAILFTAELLILFLLPFVFKYGIERGRMMMMVISFSLFGGIVLLGKFLKGILTTQRITHLETLLPLLPWIGIITLLIVAYFSYQLSSRIVLKKEY